MNLVQVGNPIPVRSHRPLHDSLVRFEQVQHPVRWGAHFGAAKLLHDVLHGLGLVLFPDQRAGDADGHGLFVLHETVDVVHPFIIPTGALQAQGEGGPALQWLAVDQLLGTQAGGEALFEHDLEELGAGRQLEADEIHVHRVLPSGHHPEAIAVQEPHAIGLLRSVDRTPPWTERAAAVPCE